MGSAERVAAQLGRATGRVKRFDTVSEKDDTMALVPSGRLDHLTQDRLAAKSAKCFMVISAARRRSGRPTAQRTGRWQQLGQALKPARQRDPGVLEPAWWWIQSRRGD